ncbi:MAG: PL29 family lyase N-terminal domain-containing protein [Bacteroidales bacterium]|nr:PL29 family lyase N-terminal domain-containing protein [Bacteroidales bacterium]MDD4669408.1 PL29 family lyase N-terminal domain-containing protein [Bacteroidales bacterium]
MKRLTLFSIFISAVLMLSGCHADYYKSIEEMKARVAELQILCDRMNTNLASIQRLTASIKSKDMISGITSITEGGKVIGYKINFVEASSVTIYNGTNGMQPLLGSKKDSDGNYYWTIQYGEGNAKWVTDAAGKKILAIGITPFIKIRDDRWLVSYDSGVTWTDVGQATGENGDSMFKSFDTSNPEYVIITLSNGTVFKIPTFSAYEQVRKDITATNDNTNAQKTIISALIDSCTYIRTVRPVMQNKDTVGTYVELSNGKNFTIHNWVGSNVPKIFAKEDTDDHTYYWAIQYGEAPATWILTDTGEKIKAAADKITAPKVDIARDTDGFYYWTVQYGDESPKFIYANDNTRPLALDSTANTIFRNVDYSYPEYLRLITITGEVYYLPKQYTVLMSEAIVMAPNTTSLVSYRVYGDDDNITTLSFITQAGFKAVKSGTNQIQITAPAAFDVGTGRIVVMFHINSAINVVKTINIQQ